MLNFLLGLFISSTLFEFFAIIYLLNKKKEKNVVTDYDVLKNDDVDRAIDKSDFFR